MKNISLLLLGCGGVGRQLIQHILSCRSLHADQGIYLRVAGVSDSNCLVTSDPVNGHLDDSQLLEMCRVKSNAQHLSSCEHLGKCLVHDGEETKMKIMEISATLGKSTGLVLVDCTASSKTVEILSNAIHFGCCAVLANKKPLTSSMENYKKLVAYPGRLRFESTVGAGLPIITTISRILNSGDPIHRLIGSLSGTLGYVMSEVEKGKAFSEVVVAAKKQGFTEPDPRDDLSGMDVARKALIIGRLIGMQISMEDIKVESMFPDEMSPGSLSVEEFMGKGLLSLNESVGEKVEKAAKRGNVVRYVCLIEGPICEVGLKEVSVKSALGALQGSDNVVEVFTRCYKDRPLVIQGAGAGNYATAAALLSDIVDLQPLF